MHQYLKAIGFGNIRTRNDLTNILDDVQESFNQQYAMHLLFLFAQWSGYQESKKSVVCL